MFLLVISCSPRRCRWILWLRYSNSCYSSGYGNANATSGCARISHGSEQKILLHIEEVAVKVMKKLLKKSKKAKVDIYKSLLEWRNTVTPGTNSSPMQKLMSRRARSFLPCKEEKYSPKIVSKVPENIIERKRISKYYHDKSARTLPELIVGQPVRVKTHPQLKKQPMEIRNCAECYVTTH